MEISKVQNNSRAFKGLCLDRNIRPIDMKKIIKPCLESIKNISDEYNICLKSGTVMQHGQHFKSPRPAIDITITPKDEFLSRVAVSKQTMPIRDYDTDKETLFAIIKSTIRNIF